MTRLVSNPTGRFAYELGEGPVWNPFTKTLSTVDIFKRTVHQYRVVGDSLEHIGQFETEGDIGAALPLRDGSFVLCENHGVFLRDPEGKRHQIASMPVSGDEFRCNDAKIGPDGKLWVGIMDYDASEGNGSLWRISRSGETEQLLGNLTIPNGMDWNGGRFWFVNGPTEEIRSYHWDESGLKDSGRTFKTNGTPDGLAFDSEGGLWLALWGEGRVAHFNQAGEVVDTVTVASPHSTSLCFADENLDLLVVTSAQFAMNQADLNRFDRAGDLFTVRLDVFGRLSNFDFG